MRDSLSCQIPHSQAVSNAANSALNQLLKDSAPDDLRALARHLRATNADLNDWSLRLDHMGAADGSRHVVATWQGEDPFTTSSSIPAPHVNTVKKMMQVFNADGSQLLQTRYFYTDGWTETADATGMRIAVQPPSAISAPPMRNVMDRPGPVNGREPFNGQANEPNQASRPSSSPSPSRPQASAPTKSAPGPKIHLEAGSPPQKSIPMDRR
jgi:hypothetical protein